MDSIQLKSFPHNYTLHKKKKKIILYLDWKRPSGWLQSREGLLFVTYVSRTCVEAIFWINWTVKMASTQVSQSQTTVLLWTPITQMIFFNQGKLLLGSNHFLLIINFELLHKSFNYSIQYCTTVPSPFYSYCIVWLFLKLLPKFNWGLQFTVIVLYQPFSQILSPFSQHPSVDFQGFVSCWLPSTYSPFFSL